MLYLVVAVAAHTRPLPNKRSHLEESGVLVCVRKEVFM